MMSKNPLAIVGTTSAKSPTDPQECCDWANERLHPKAFEAGLRWYVTGKRDRPIELRKIAAVLR